MTFESKTQKNGVKNTQEKSGDDGGTSVTTNHPKSFEDVYTALGPIGRYHFIQIAMLSTTMIILVFIGNKYVFITRESEFSCAVLTETELFESLMLPLDNNHSYMASYDKSCEIEIFKNESGTLNSVKTVGCIHGYDYGSDKDKSFINEWDLVCDKEGLPQLVQSLKTIGRFLGGILVNAVGDKYGRWKIMTVSIVLTVVTDIAATYSPNIYTMIALSFVSGFMSAGVYVCSWVLTFEMIVEKYRVRFCMINGIVFSTIGAIFCAIGYAFRNFGWRDFNLYSGIMGITPLFFVYFINESPSWLQSVGKTQKSETIIQRACKINQVDYDDKVKDTFYECFDVKTTNVGEGSVHRLKTDNTLDLFRHKKYLKILVITWIASFTQELTSSGLFLTASTLSGDLYLNTALLAMVSIPSYILSTGLQYYNGRRLVIAMFTLIAGTCLLVSPLITYADLDADLSNKISLAFFIMGNFAISGAYQTFYIYVPEVYPTSLRATGTGISLSGATIGGAIAPYLLPLSKTAHWAPGITLCSCCLFTSLLFTKLPETKGKKVAMTIEDDE